MFGPNSSGFVRVYTANSGQMLSSILRYSEGAFSLDQQTNYVTPWGEITAENAAYTRLSLTLSRSNAIYNGSTEQSPALQTLPCIRY